MPPIYGLMSGSVGGQSDLAAAASSMSAGQTVNFTVGAWDLTMFRNTGGTDVGNVMIADSVRAYFDPFNEQIHYFSQNHTPNEPTANSGCFLRYTIGTNLWEKAASYAGQVTNEGHPYYHYTIVPSSGVMYHRKYASSTVRRRLSGSTSWTEGQVAAIPDAEGSDSAAALEWFPGLNSGNGWE